MKRNFFLFFVPLLLLSSCFGGSSGSYVGTWVGSSTQETTANRDYPYNDRTTTNYTITIESNGSCKIIERITGKVYNKPVDNSYTYYGTWEAKDGTIGEGKWYNWVQLDATTKDERNFVESNNHGSWNSSSKVSTTLSFTPDGKMWGGSLNAQTLANAAGTNSYGGVTQLRKQN